MCDVFPNNIRPPNVSFQVGNTLKRLPFSDNTFDFVNIRLFIIALKKEEWPILMQEAYRVLKPGGFIQMVECGMLVSTNTKCIYKFALNILFRKEEMNLLNMLVTYVSIFWFVD